MCSVNQAMLAPMEAFSGHALRASLLQCLGQLIARCVLLASSVQLQAVVLCNAQMTNILCRGKLNAMIVQKDLRKQQ